MVVATADPAHVTEGTPEPDTELAATLDHDIHPGIAIKEAAATEATAVGTYLREDTAAVTESVMVQDRVTNTLKTITKRESERWRAHFFQVLPPGLADLILICIRLQ